MDWFISILISLSVISTEQAYIDYDILKITNLPNIGSILETSSEKTEVYAVKHKYTGDGTLRFTLIPLEGVDVPFSINTKNGKVFVNADPGLDFELGNRTYKFKVAVSDGTVYDESDLHIYVENVDEPPVLLNLPAAVNVSEFSQDEPRTLLHELEAYDQDGKELLPAEAAFEPDDGNLVSASSEGKFQIFFKEKPTFDYETTAVYHVTIKVSDGTLTSESELTVNIINENEEPDVTNLPAETSVYEDAKPGQSIFQLTLDPDQDHTHFEVEVTPHWYQEVFNITLDGDVSVTASGILDYENGTNPVQVRITLCDPLYCSDPKILTVTVLDANEPPAIVLEDTLAVSENTVRTVGESVPLAIEVLDTDQDDAHTFNMTGRHAGYFTMDPINGDVILRKPINKEDRVVFPDGQLEIDLTVTDSGGLVDFKHLVIQILDINEFHPQFIKDIYRATVEENLPPGKYILTVRARDLDRGKISFTVEPPGDKYLSFEQSGTEADLVTIDEPLDRELHRVLKFPVVVKDSGGFTATATVELTLTNVNDNRPKFHAAIFNMEVRADAAVGTSIARATAEDKDVDDNKLTYSLLEISAPGAFHVGPIDGQVTVTSPLEEGRTYILYVDATDSGKPPLSAERPAKVVITTYSPEAVLTDWMFDVTRATFGTLQIQQFLRNVARKCHPCVPKIAEVFPAQTPGHVVLRTYILSDNTTRKNFLPKDHVLELFSSSPAEGTPNALALEASPAGTPVVKLTNSYGHGRRHWLLDTLLGNIVLGIICFIGISLVSSVGAFVLDRYWIRKRSLWRYYQSGALGTDPFRMNLRPNRSVPNSRKGIRRHLNLMGSHPVCDDQELPGTPLYTNHL